MDSQLVPTLALSILISAALGSGMMAGLFCAFSNFVMRALSRLPPTRAISAMQSINEVIVRPAFLIVFLGTSVACALAFGLGWEHLSKDTLAYVACIYSPSDAADNQHCVDLTNRRIIKQKKQQPLK